MNLWKKKFGKRKDFAIANNIQIQSSIASVEVLDTFITRCDTDSTTNPIIVSTDEPSSTQATISAPSNTFQFPGGQHLALKKGNQEMAEFDDNHHPPLEEAEVKDEVVEEECIKDIRDLDDELANLDIDNDFTLSLSFVTDSKELTDNTAQPRDNNDENQNDVLVHDYTNPEYAMAQLERMEVYSHLYQPSRNERAALQTLATRLGVKNSMFGTSGFSVPGPNPSILLTLLNIQEQDHHASAANSTLHADNQKMGKSIILKQGPVRIGHQDLDLILLTHGFILARPINKGPSSTNAFAFFSTPVLYEHVHLYNHIDYIKDLWQLRNLHRVSLHVSSTVDSVGELYLDFDSPETKQEWLEAWERVLLRNRTIYSSAFQHTVARQHQRIGKHHNDDDQTPIIGWQHELLQTSLYTAAVTGQAFFSKRHLEKLNELDEYNGMAPLHYAALHNQMHIIEHLCSDDCGADVEVKDAEGRTPMYYAQRDNLEPSIHALRDAGAVDSTALHSEQHGLLIEEARLLEHRLQKQKQKQKHETEKDELFKSVQERDEIPRTRRSPWLTIAEAIAGTDKEKDHQQQHDDQQKVTKTQASARRAQTNIMDGMNALNDRGMKIQQLSEKTDSLENNTVEYKDLAAQVRMKLEKQNKGLNFLNPFAR